MIISGCDLQLDPEAGFGPAHFIMMGLNEETNGSYSGEDEFISRDVKTRAERTKVNLEEAGRRIEKMGFGGLMTHLAKKIMICYGDGAFTWEKEEPFYAYETYYFPLGFRWGYDHIPNFYIDAQYEDMVDWSCSDVYRTIAQCAWMAVLFLGIFAFSRKTDERGAALLLSLIGMLLFQLLFECRGRYEFCYAPVHILAAGLGIATLKEIFGRIRKKDKAKASPA